MCGSGARLPGGAEGDAQKTQWSWSQSPVGAELHGYCPLGSGLPLLLSSGSAEWVVLGDRGSHPRSVPGSP